MVEEFFNSLLEGDSIKAPEPVLEAFGNKFPEAINVEWYRSNDNFEAIFYDNDIEKIARFQPDGAWMETRINRDIDRIPSNVRKEAEKNGEIMSAIEFESSESKKYEFIVRDTSLNRFVLIINSAGEILKDRPLP